MFTEHMFERITETPRDRWGRPLIIPPEGGKPVPYTRATTFVDALDDKYNLQKWMQRMVAVGVSIDPALRLSIASLATDPESNKRQLDELCDKARTRAGADDKADIGTALHQLTEHMDRGHQLTPEIAGEYQPHLDAYQEATAGFTHRHIEQFTVCDQWQVGGTPDRISEIPGENGLFVLDLKTGPSTLKYGALKVAMQMAVYAHSELYLDGVRTPIPELNQERGVVIALDSETAKCELHWIDLKAGWEAACLSGEVRRWRAQKGITQPYKPHTQPELPDLELGQQILACTTLEQARELWAANPDIWTDAHTALLKQHLK